MSNDTINGGAGNDTILGGEGNDLLSGGAGNDLIIGGVGLDTLMGDSGNDTLEGGEGADALFGGSGFDLVSYENSSGGVIARLDGGSNAGSEAAGDTITSIEGVIGTAFADTLLAGGSIAARLDGGAGDDRLIGSSGGDTLLGGADSDTMDGGLGSDSLNGGTGLDTASYADSSQGILVRLDGGDNIGGTAAGDILVSIEAVSGSFFDDVFIARTGLGASFSGGDGADRLIGNSGDDTLFGGAGNDTLESSTGDDVIDGGSGFDFVSYGDSSAGVTVRLDGGSSTGGAAEGDSITSVEGVTGSFFNDAFIARVGVGANMSGGGGNDRLIGNSGNDTLSGGNGDDTIESGIGADIINGGSGFDIVRYADSAAGVTVRLDGGTSLGGSAAGDVIASVEGVAGSFFDDAFVARVGFGASMTGGAGNDRLIGNSGNDTLSGGADDDTLEAGAGNDVLIGGSGDDLFVITNGTGNDTIFGFAAGVGANDIAELSGFGTTLDNFTEVLAAGVDTASGYLIDLGGGGTLLLNDVAEASLDISDFAFS